MTHAAALSLAPHHPPCLPAVEPPRPARGPGWFDSSWELASGLEVREGWPADIGLFDWLDRFLQTAAQDPRMRSLTAWPSSSTAIA